MILGLRAFGLDLDPEFALPGAWARRPVGADALRIVLVERDEIETLWRGEAAPGWEGWFGDGERFVCLRGSGGDHHFAYGEHATFHLSADTRLLRCAPSDPDDLAWQRVLLDSVLFSVALLRGRDALHAAAVQTPAGVLALSAHSGGGKSTLCSELLRRGRSLVADDIVMLSRRDRMVLAHPGPPVMNVAPDRAGAGQHLATFCDDAWSAVPVVAEPLELGAIVLLRRAAGAALACQRMAADPLRLLPNILRFPRTREHERVRFELACDLAARVPVYELSADLDVDPSRLADELEAAVHAGASPRSEIADVAC
ncbi:MAG: hypothetical protein M3376_02135 [Actinomycetota bacterium]|nr:hypothetical protein [Actinomycetota bacterium]